MEPWGEEQGWQRNQKLLELQLASKRAESRETWTATEKERERERESERERGGESESEGESDRE